MFRSRGPLVLPLLLPPLLLLASAVPGLLGARVQRRLQRLFSERLPSSSGPKDDDVFPVSGTFDNDSHKPRPLTAEAMEEVSWIEQEKPGPPQVPPRWDAREVEPLIAVSGTLERHPEKRASLIEASATGFASPEEKTRQTEPSLGTWARWADGKTSVSVVSGTFDDMSRNPEKRARLLALPEFSTWAKEDAMQLGSSGRAVDGLKAQMMSSEIFMSPTWTTNATMMQNQPENPYAAAASQVLALSLAQQQPGWHQTAAGSPALLAKQPTDSIDRMHELLNTNPIPTKQPKVITGGASPGLGDTVERLIPDRNKVTMVFSWMTLVSFAVGICMPCSLVCCGLAKMPDIPDGSLPS